MSSRRNVLAGVLVHWPVIYVPVFMALVFSMMSTHSAPDEAFFALIFPLHMATMVISVVSWIWMLVHAIKNKALSDNERVLWVVVCAVAGWLGSVVYYWAHFRSADWAALAEADEAPAF